MRFTSVTIAAALTLVTISTALHGQKRDDQIDPRSTTLLAKGEAAAKAGDLDAAADTLETALAVDPRNRAAFVALGDVTRERGMPGKAIKLYREALNLDPNDLAALQGEGEALVARGAVEQARADLAKLRRLCAKACPQATSLAAAIAKGPPATALAAKTEKEAQAATATAD
ncbi:MAG TPA: tetratricopeptide repeat protein [Sphingomonas sp.]|nr:tetratricopeptide repeat protein [Sphingomonas sp.]